MAIPQQRAVDSAPVSGSEIEAAPELAVVLPSYNERANIVPMLEALEVALADIRHEVIIVDDDSPDGTWALAQQLALTRPRLRCLRRVGRRGLASAAIEGMLATGAPYIAVMDADLQHDERALTRMLARAREVDADVVVGSRFAEGASVGDDFAASRLMASRVATWLCNRMVPGDLTDPLSGFFMMRRDFFVSIVRRIRTDGFKVLVDALLVAPPDVRLAEVPFDFRGRRQGVSKLDALVVWNLGLSLATSLTFGLVPRRFLSFIAVGGMGAAVHMAVLALGYRAMGLAFGTAQVAAIIVAMTFNFFLNNSLTFRDRRLRGPRLLLGLGVFYLSCSLGAVVNYAVSARLFDAGIHWALAGFVGAVAGAGWNFAMTSVFAWRAR